MKYMIRYRKKLLILVLTLISLLFLDRVLANDVVKKQVEILTGNIKVYLNGKELSLTDFNNNRVEPIMYNGELYLPVTATAKSLGLNVEYNSGNNSVLLGYSPINHLKPDNLLQDAKIIKGSKPYSISSNHKNNKSLDLITDNFDNNYKDYIYGLDNKTTFLLNSKYQEFTTTIVYRQGLENLKKAYKLKFLVNDKEVYESKVFYPDTRPENVKIDLFAGDKLEIQIYSQNTRNFDVDEKNWKMDSKTPFENRAIAIVNPYLYLKK